VGQLLRSASAVGAGRRTDTALSPGRTDRFLSSPKRPHSLLFIAHGRFFFWGVKQLGRSFEYSNKTTTTKPHPIFLMLGPHSNVCIDQRTARICVTARSKCRLPESDGVRSTIQVKRGPVRCLVKRSVVRSGVRYLLGSHWFVQDT